MAYLTSILIPYTLSAPHTRMNFSTYKTSSGFLLPSIHSAPPFFTLQTNSATQAAFTEQWTRLLLAYARHHGLFILRIEDAEHTGGGGGGGHGAAEWDEVLKNPRINRRLKPTLLADIIGTMVRENLAVYEPPKQTRAVVLYWRLPEEWAEVLHEWATKTGQLNTILTFYEISNPPVPSALSGIPESLLRNAISVLAKSGGRAQLISISDGDGVRFFPRTAK